MNGSVTPAYESVFVFTNDCPCVSPAAPEVDASSITSSDVFRITAAKGGVVLISWLLFTKDRN